MKLAPALLLAAAPAFAEPAFSTDTAEGATILAFHTPCVLHSQVRHAARAEYRLPGQPPIEGCWTIIHDTVFFLWADGDASAMKAHRFSESKGS